MNPPPPPIVMKAFQAIMKRDFPTFRETLAPDCALSTTFPATQPFGGDSQGSQAVTEQFQRITQQFDVFGTEMKDIVSQGDTVVLVFNEKVRSRSTQKEAVNRVVAVVKLQSDRISSIRVFVDAYTMMGLL